MNSRIATLRFTPSPIGLGCAPVLGRVGRRAALIALSAALDDGITYFDVARSYGYGEAEGLLGKFLGGRRDQVLISTKAGIKAQAQPAWKRFARTVVRPVLRRVPIAKKMIRARIAAEFKSGFFSPDDVRQSLETSLRELRTDYVDILYLHDCTEHDLRNEVLQRELQRLRDAGKTLHVGVASGVREASVAAHEFGETYSAALTPCNFLDPTLGSDFPSGFLIFGREPLGGSAGLSTLRLRLLSMIQGSIETDTLQLARRVRELSDAEFAELALAWSAYGSHMISTVASFFSPEHIRSNLALLRRNPWSERDLELIRRALRSAGSEPHPM